MANNMHFIVREDIEVPNYKYEEDIEDFEVRQEQSEHIQCTYFYF